MQGKTIAITGATGRLGQRLVQHATAAGATVIALVQDEAKADRLTLGTESRAFGVNVTDEDSVVACFGRIRDHYGHLDVLIHTVGAWGMKPLLGTTQHEWEDFLARNLTSTFLCFREAARLMTGRGGRLIAFTAGQGADRGVAQQGAYAAAKAGVIRLVEAVADEFDAADLTAHAIAPSMVLYDGEVGTAGVSAEDLIALCAHLISPAGAALNGATLRAYGT